MNNNATKFLSLFNNLSDKKKQIILKQIYSEVQNNKKERDEKENDKQNNIIPNQKEI